MARVVGRPSPRHLRAVQQAAILRGGIITSYAQVEMLLGDVVMRCMDRPEYAFLPKDFPQHITSRIARVRSIVGAPGLLASYGAAFEAIISGLRRFEELRHFMAHGLLHIVFRGDTVTFQYRMWRQPKAARPEMGTMTTTPDELARAAAEIGAYSTEAVTLFRDVYLDHELQPV